LNKMLEFMAPSIHGAGGPEHQGESAGGMQK